MKLNFKDTLLVFNPIGRLIRQHTGGWQALSRPGLVIGAGILLLGPGALIALAQGSGQGPSYNFKDVFFAFVVLSLLILVGRWIRQSVPLFQALFLPSSIVAGTVALLLGPATLGAIASSVVGKDFFLANGLFPQPIRDVWSAVPGVFINIVFATIFLGEFIPSPRDIWRRAAPQVAFGQTLAWGQYVVGLLLAQKGYISVTRDDNLWQEAPGESHNESPEIREKRAKHLRSLLIDPLSLHFGFVGVAVGIGWLILQALTFIESITWNRGGNGLEILSGIPLFPLALVGGIIVQLILERLNRTYLINRQLMNHIGGVALDVTIVAALASISLAVLGSNLGAFLILSLAGIAWNVLVFIYLAPRMIPTYWFERGIGDMGQSMGVTATGLLLMRMVDPDNTSGAFESFAYKQLFFEPIVGGGLFTAAAPPLIRQFGPIPVLLLTSGLLAFWLIFGFWNYRQMSKPMAATRG